MDLSKCIEAEVAKQVAKQVATESGNNPLRVGNTVFIRTVTYYYTGRIVAITDNDILLAEAAWVADSGRWADAIATGKLSEVEPYPDDAIVAVNREIYCDAVTWNHPLPRDQK